MQRRSRPRPIGKSAKNHLDRRLSKCAPLHGHPNGPLIPKGVIDTDQRFSTEESVKQPHRPDPTTEQVKMYYLNGSRWMAYTISLSKVWAAPVTLVLLLMLTKMVKP